MNIYLLSATFLIGAVWGIALFWTGLRQSANKKHSKLWDEIEYMRKVKQ